MRFAPDPENCGAESLPASPPYVSLALLCLFSVGLISCSRPKQDVPEVQDVTVAPTMSPASSPVMTARPVEAPKKPEVKLGDAPLLPSNGK